MDKNLILEVKKKKEFSQLPDSIVEKVLVINKFDIKKSRAFLRKYFGVFLTNKVLKIKNLEDYQEVLKTHISSKKRDYSILYERISSIFSYNFYSVFDMGSGLNGFSYPYIKKYFGDVNYYGFESTNQIVENTNNFFKRMNFDKAFCYNVDIFDLNFLKSKISVPTKPRLFLLFQIVDALENIKKNFSKELLDFLKENISNEDIIIISNPVTSISGKNMFKAKKYWLEIYLESNFYIVDRFELFQEKFIIFKKN